MGKEINIDEILTRSHKQVEEKQPKESKIIDSETGEEMTQSPRCFQQGLSPVLRSFLSNNESCSS